MKMGGVGRTLGSRKQESSREDACQSGRQGRGQQGEIPSHSCACRRSQCKTQEHPCTYRRFLLNLFPGLLSGFHNVLNCPVSRRHACIRLGFADQQMHGIHLSCYCRLVHGLVPFCILGLRVSTSLHSPLTQPLQDELTGAELRSVTAAPAIRMSKPSSSTLNIVTLRTKHCSPFPSPSLPSLSLPVLAALPACQLPPLRPPPRAHSSSRRLSHPLTHTPPRLVSSFRCSSSLP